MRGLARTCVTYLTVHKQGLAHDADPVGRQVPRPLHPYSGLIKLRDAPFKRPGDVAEVRKRVYAPPVKACAGHVSQQMYGQVAPLGAQDHV